MAAVGAEAIAAVGRQAGSAQALTVVLPLRRGGAAFLALWLTYLRLLPDGRLPLLRRVPFLSRHGAVRTLDRLRFVSAIRWSLLPPLRPGRGWRRDADARWHLLFESNFDGDWDDYLDSFGAVMSGPLQTIVWVGRGFPGLDHIGLFKAYTRQHDVTPAHYVSAYDELTSGAIYQALLRLEGRQAHRTALERGYGRSHPCWTTFLLPIRADQASAARRAAQALDDPLPAPPGRRPSESVPLILWTGLVHFGRVAVLTRPSGDWLLMTFTHDGTTDELIESLVATDTACGVAPGDGSGAPPVTRLRRLLECCDRVPAPSAEAWDDEALADRLRAAVPPSSRFRMAYCGYPGRTVTEIRALVAAAPDVSWPQPEDPG